jgi:hypothetical protein
MILGKLTEEQEWDYDPSDDSEPLFEEDDDEIRGPHGYNRNCMCYSCNPPG